MSQELIWTARKYKKSLIFAIFEKFWLWFFWSLFKNFNRNWHFLFQRSRSSRPMSHRMSDDISRLPGKLRIVLLQQRMSPGISRWVKITWSSSLFKECDAGCPCGLDCPAGCQDCPEHPLCEDDCEDAQINNDKYRLCLNEAVFHLVSEYSDSVLIQKSISGRLPENMPARHELPRFLLRDLQGAAFRLPMHWKSGRQMLIASKKWKI